MMKKSRENIEIEESEKRIWYPFAVIFVLCILGLYGIVYAVDQILPTPLKIEDEINNPNRFIAERAQIYLKGLTDLGPKVTGSDVNEIYAIEYITKIIDGIIANANAAQKIEISQQMVSGSYYRTYNPSGTISIYTNIQNIVVKVYSAAETNHSVLVNTHFDTVPGSPGGSDDCVNVAIALEILRKFSQSSTRPTNNLVFLFNGAEETGLRAAHGFITQHKWRQEIRVLINLEATGGSGKEILFQSGPNESWLLKYYDVPHPHCTVAAEEIFQSSIIPSDTDFRIFRDFGGVVGFDFAFYRDGYRYHTKYDGFDNIKNGTYQSTGDNMLHLLRNLAEAREVSDPIQHSGKAIFFEFIGLFYIYYSETVAYIVNIITVVASLLVMIWTCITYRTSFLVGLIYLPATMLLKILGILISCGYTVLLAVILDAANSTMSWYKIPMINFGLYMAPIVFCLLLTSVGIQRIVKNDELSLSQKIILQIHASRFFWTIMLLVGTILKLRMIYFVMISVLFTTVAMFIIQCFKLHKHDAIWIPIYIISTILPTMYLMYITHVTLALFMPLMGRFGSSVNPEILVAVVLVLAISKIISYFVPLFLFIKKPWYILLVLVALSLVCFIIVLTPVGFPYVADKENPKPQKYSIFHTERTLRNDTGDIIKSDAGFYFYRNDRNTPNAIRGSVTALENAVSVIDDCNIAIACGLPLTYIQSNSALDNNVWIPTGFPIFPSALTTDCTPENMSNNQVKYHCIIEGCYRIDVFLSIRNGSKLLSISLVDAIDPNPRHWNDQLLYHMSFAYGKGSPSFTFDFVIQRDEGTSGPLADFTVIGKYIHDEKIQKTDEYQSFLAEFPAWTVMQTEGLAHYQSFVLL